MGARLGGRQKGTPNKVTAELREIAQPFGPEAVKTLVKIMRSSKFDQCKIMAADKLLDRGFGKPTEYKTNLNLNVPEYDLSHLTDEQLAAVEQIVESASRSVE